MAIVALVMMLVSTFAGTAVFAEGRYGGGQQGDQAGGEGGRAGSVAFLRFKDMDEQPWAEASIAKMNARGIIRGYEDGTFQGNKPVTRAELAALAVRLVNKEAQALALSNPALSFTDMMSIALWARPYIALAVMDGLMAGALEDGRKVFQANKPATRLEVAVIMVRALGLEDQAKAVTTPLTFADTDKIPTWAAGYVAVAVQKGIVTGYPDNTFQPNKPVTRAEMAAFLDRTDDNMNDATVVSEVRGVIKSVSTAPASITLTVRGADQTIRLVDNAVIYLNKQPAALADLKAGDHAVVVKNSDGMGVYVGAKREDGEDGEGNARQPIAGLDVTFSTDKDSYQLAADTATFTLTIRNTTAQPINLEFASGQSFDFTVSKGDDMVWQWSHGQAFTQIVSQMTLASAETKTYTGTWDLKNNDGQAVEAGTYQVNGWITAHLQGSAQKPAAPAPKEITVVAASTTPPPPAPSTIEELTVSVATNKTSYVPVENVIMSITLTNTTGSDIVIEAPTAQQYDLIVKKDGQKVWQWSDGRTFAQTATILTILANQSVSFNETWNQNDTAGQAAGVGTYTVEGSVVGHAANGSATPAVPAAVTFAVAQP